MIELALLLLGLGSTEFTVAVRDSATGKLKVTDVFFNN